jgi:AcrR family transcriptional regulator
MTRNTKAGADRRKRPRKRAEQQRSIETRVSILNAAIAEFAERGFEGASIRAIADRLGLRHPLITYHYRSKEILWRAAAEHAFSQIRGEWDVSASEDADLSPMVRLHQEDTTLFRYRFLNFIGSCARKPQRTIRGLNGWRRPCWRRCWDGCCRKSSKLKSGGYSRQSIPSFSTI